MRARIDDEGLWRLIDDHWTPRPAEPVRSAASRPDHDPSADDWPSWAAVAYVVIVLAVCVVILGACSAVTR